MAYGQYPEYIAFQRSMADMDNIRHGIDQISEKVFAKNLINETNKCLNADIGDQERTKYLKSALLDRTKSRPDTFGTFVEVLKDTHGLDFIADLLEKNLNDVKVEQVATTRDTAVGCDNVPSDSSVESEFRMRRSGGLDNGVSAFRREYSPFQGSGYWVETHPPRRRSRDLTPAPTGQKAHTSLKSRSRSLTPPPTNNRSHKIPLPSIPFYMDSQPPDTPPFLPITNFKLHNKTSETPATPTPETTPQPSPVSEHNKNCCSLSHSEHKKMVRFSTPALSDPEKELVIHVPMPVSSSEREETTSNPSPSLVTGQSCKNFRSSLEVPTSPNVAMLRSQSSESTESTDTDSDVYTTPRQSMSDVEADKLHRKCAKAKKAAMCKNCLTLRRHLSDSQEVISKLEAKLQARNELMFSQVSVLREEMLQKELECCNLKDACGSAVVFVQELEAKVAKLKQLVYSKGMETEEAWRYYNVALDFVRKCSSIQADYGPYAMQGQREERDGSLEDDDEDRSFKAEQSYLIEDGSDLDGGGGNRTNRWRSQGQGVSIHKKFVHAQNSEAEAKSPSQRVHGSQKRTPARKESHSRSSKLITMMKRAIAPSLPPRRVASDHHPRKKHGVCPSQGSLQHDAELSSANMRTRHCTYPLQLQGEVLQTDAYYLSTEAHELFHKPRQGTLQGWKHRVPQVETGYWEEEERLQQTNKEGGSFVPDEGLETQKGVA